jgi:hypothetical protein
MAWSLDTTYSLKEALHSRVVSIALRVAALSALGLYVEVVLLWLVLVKAYTLILCIYHSFTYESLFVKLFL